MTQSSKNTRSVEDRQADTGQSASKATTVSVDLSEALPAANDPANGYSYTEARATDDQATGEQATGEQATDGQVSEARATEESLPPITLDADRSTAESDSKQQGPVVGSLPQVDRNAPVASATLTAIPGLLADQPDNEPKSTQTSNLYPIRCFNYHTQLRVAGKLITECLDKDQGVVLILDKNAESALETLEQLGFTLREALLERKLDIYYYRKGVRNRNFFKSDYQMILEAVQVHRPTPVKRILMMEFNTLFANNVQDALRNQITDFLEVCRSNEHEIVGLYSPTSWYQIDPLSRHLPAFIGNKRIKEAKARGGTGVIKYSLYRNTAIG